MHDERPIAEPTPDRSSAVQLGSTIRVASSREYNCENLFEGIISDLGAECPARDGSACFWGVGHFGYKGCSSVAGELGRRCHQMAGQTLTSGPRRTGRPPWISCTRCEALAQWRICCNLENRGQRAESLGKRHKREPWLECQRCLER